ncbi:hypothetical protein BGX21_009110, partial [Mortierella sp. AD011]
EITWERRKKKTMSKISNQFSRSGVLSAIHHYRSMPPTVKSSLCLSTRATSHISSGTTKTLPVALSTLQQRHY